MLPPEVAGEIEAIREETTATRARLLELVALLAVSRQQQHDLYEEDRRLRERLQTLQIRACQALGIFPKEEEEDED